MIEYSSSEEGELQSLNSNSSGDEMENRELLQFVEVRSRRGASLLSRDGYEYAFEKDSAMIENVEYWRCPRRPPYCPGRIYLHSAWHEGEGVRFKLGWIRNEAHSHCADYEKETLRNAIELLKRLARAPNPVLTREAVDQARAALSAEARVNAPGSSSMRKTFQRERRKAAEQLGDRGLDTPNPLNLVVPQNLQHTVIMNEGVEIGGQLRKIIVFATPWALNVLDNYRAEIAIDGTFKTAPRGFGQLFTVHAVIDSCAVPCIFACLPTKHMYGYVRVFEAVQNNINNWTPERVMSDFEAAEIAAIRHVFPQSVITGCVFHLSNAIYKHIQTLPGLNTRYRDNRNDRYLIRSLTALAFVTINEVYTFMCILMDALMGPPEREVLALLKYFVLSYIGPSYIVAHPQILPGAEEAIYGDGCDGWLRAWIAHENLAHRNALFPIEIWNLTERIQDGLSRTNNSLEGWHSAWGSLLDRKPLFSKFVKRMIKEFSRWENIMADFENSPANGIRGKGLKRKNIYVAQDNNLQQLFAEFERRADDPIRYLRTISHHLAEI